MKATQSSIALETWCQTEQIAVLRYVSRYLTRADLPPFELPRHAGPDLNSTPPHLQDCAGGLVCEAGHLLRAMRTCKELLAYGGLSAAERECSLAHLEALEATSLVLVDLYASRSRIESKSARPFREDLELLEQGVEWLPC